MTHRDKVLLVGSCFSQHIGEYLQYRGIRTCRPFGPLFNPASICAALHRLRENRPVSESELFEENGLWHHFDFHSAYSRCDRQEALQAMNDCIGQGHRFLAEATCVIISLGTACVYRHRASGQVVANCHHVPAAQFDRSRLSVGQTTAYLREISEMLEGRKVLLTISPIRHLRDGLHANNLSKSTLLLSVDQLQEENPDIAYFPAYELLLDDLRDYRFYGDDLVHPTRLAVEYIGEQFTRRYWSPATCEAAHAFMEIHKAESHRLQHPDSAMAKSFQAQTAAKRMAWEKQHYTTA